MFGETTDPNLGHPTAPTVFDQRELLQRLEAARARLARRTARGKQAPSLLWEEAGLHGERREVSLRGRRSPLVHGRVPRTSLAGTRLPAAPTPHGLTTRHVVIAAGVVSAVVLGVYLWRRSQEKK